MVHPHNVLPLRVIQGIGTIHAWFGVADTTLIKRGRESGAEAFAALPEKKLSPHSNRNLGVPSQGSYLISVKPPKL
jgi:hypothetical protein